MTISNALQRTFGNAYKNYPGDIGLEIETETTGEYKVPKFSFWSVHADGSLRGFGQEYVLKQPLDFEKTLPEALKEFKEKTKGIPFINDSITTSVHVHLNFLNDNFITLGNFLTLYSFVENILIRFSGDDRLSNLFCLPICDAEETYHNVMNMMKNLPKKNYHRLQFDVDSTKYGALNLSSLVRYGSLEVRSFRGTTDTDLIYTWTGILYSILKFARQKGLTPPDIIKIYKDKGTELLSDVFGEYRKLLRHKDEGDLLDQNLWYAVNVACSIKEWAKLEEIENIKKPKLKDLDKMALDNFGAASFETLTHDQQLAILTTAERDQAPTTGLGGIRWDELRAPIPTTPVRADDIRPTYVVGNFYIRGGQEFEVLYIPDWDEDHLDTVNWDGQHWELEGDQLLIRWTSGPDRGMTDVINRD